MCAAFAYQLLNLKVIKLLTRQFGAFYSVCVLCGWRPSTSAIRGHDESSITAPVFFLLSPKGVGWRCARRAVIFSRVCVGRRQWFGARLSFGRRRFACINNYRRTESERPIILSKQATFYNWSRGNSRFISIYHWRESQKSLCRAQPFFARPCGDTTREEIIIIFCFDARRERSRVHIGAAARISKSNFNKLNVRARCESLNI
jgi:hypothetical protein